MSGRNLTPLSWRGEGLWRSAMILLIALVVLVVVIKLALGLIVLAIGLAAAVLVYFAAEKLIGRGE